MAKKPKLPANKKPKKAKAKPREEELDDEIDDELADDEAEAKPRSGVYVGLGGITLVAFATAGAMFYLDAEAHSKPVPTVGIDLLGLANTPPKPAL